MIPFEAEVREYIKDCKVAGAELKLKRSRLDSKYHPTADGAVKMIPHGGDAGKAKLIREAYKAVKGGSDEKGAAA